MTYGETIGEYLIRVMTQRGFTPVNAFGAETIDFVKTYADAQGRTARAIAHFAKPTLADRDAGGVRLEAFTVLVQARVAATTNAVETRAPAVMHDDLLDIVGAFENWQPPPPELAVTQCSVCGADVIEYYVLHGDTVCRECRDTDETRPAT